MEEPPMEVLCASRLKVLADPTRLAILRILLRKPKHVGEINADLQIEQSLLSHHLKVLRDEHLVVAHRNGKSVLYSLAPGVADPEGINIGCCILSF